MINWFKGTALVAAIMFSGTALQANVGFTLEGCRASDTMNYHQVTLQAGDGSLVPTYICDDSAYTTGNLKGWAELDYVPHRVTVENKSSTPETFTFTVGGDFLQTEGGDLRGWDDITVLVLDPDLSDQACFDIQSQSTQALLITPDNEGAGGVFTTIYRQVNVVGLPAGARCVAHYNARLALGSHLYPGSSLQSNLWNENLDSGGIGEKRVQLPDVLAQDFSKNMQALQGGGYDWTISKSTPNTSVDFGDTCAPGAVLSKPVSITVEWERGPLTPSGTVNVTTIISGSNTAKRDLNVSIADTIYSGMTPLSVLPDPQTSTCGDHILTAGYAGEICRNTYELTTAQAVELNDKAVLTYNIYYDPVILAQGPVYTKNAEASAVVESSGENTNPTAVITDHEWISSLGNIFSYSVATPASGSLDAPYVADTVTQGDVNWTSTTQSGSGSVTLNKMIYLNGPAVSGPNDKLQDHAYLNGADGLERDYGPLAIDLSADATVTLTITKTIPDILQGAEEVLFTFTVAKEGYSEDVNVTFTSDGVTSKDIVVSGLAPGIYSVVEHSTPGFAPDGGSTKENIDLTLPTCSTSVVFDNDLTVDQHVRVAKVTNPVTIDGQNADGDWNMTLYKVVDGQNVFVSSLLTTAGAGSDEFTIPGDYLSEGNYTIMETMKAGWYQSERGAGCDFSVDYPADVNRTYECMYTNTKYAQIIVAKITDPAGSDANFTFAQDMNGTPLTLKHGWAQTYNELMPNTYTVTENDPTPAFDLVNVECVETNTDYADPNRIQVDGATATIDLIAGETVTCTYTNRERGMVEVTKIENGIAPVHEWTFTLSGPDVGTVSGTTPPNPLDFNGAKLIPGETYTLCEKAVPVAWETIWTLNGNGVIPYNPYAGTDASNEDRCIDFNVTAGQTVGFTVNNNYTPPGGEPRTIGYWKNWSTCSGGQQAEKAAEKGGAAEGFWLIDDVLPMTLGVLAENYLTLETCTDAVAILNKSDLTPKHKKRASDAAYGMAAQLVAAQANYAAGAEQCSTITDAIAAANQLLSDINFNGLGGYLSPKDAKHEPAKSQRALANSLAGILDGYNNDGCQ